MRPRPYAAAYAALARRRRAATRDPQADAEKYAQLRAAMAGAEADTPPRPGGVIDLFIQHILTRLGEHDGDEQQPTVEEHE